MNLVALGCALLWAGSVCNCATEAQTGRVAVRFRVGEREVDASQVGLILSDGRRSVSLRIVDGVFSIPPSLKPKPLTQDVPALLVTLIYESEQLRLGEIRATWFTGRWDIAIYRAQFPDDMMWAVRRIPAPTPQRIVRIDYVQDGADAHKFDLFPIR